MKGAAGKLALAMVCVGLQAGCSTAPGGDGPGNTLANLVLFNSSKAPAPTPPPEKRPPHVTCPDIEVQDGTEAVRIYAGAVQTNAGLRYQFAIDNVARDCQLADGRLSIKVGVAGRVLLGPAGGPSSFTVPVRVVVRRESDAQAAVSQIYRIAATLQQGETATNFSVVTDPLSVPFVHADADRDYTILVGFDQGAGPAKAQPKRRKRS